MKSKPNRNGLAISQTLLVSLVTRRSADQFQKLTQTLLLFLNDQPTSIVDRLVETGALSLLSIRLISAFAETMRSTEVLLLSAVLHLLVIRSDKHVPCEFITRMGISFVADLSSYLQISRKDSAGVEPLHHLFGILGSLPWSRLPRKEYSQMVQLLHQILRCSATPRMCASVFDFFHGLAIDDEKKVFLVEHPGLVEELLEKADYFISYNNKVSAHQVASSSCRLLHRLAWGADNRARFASKRAWTKVLVALAGNPDQTIKKQALEIIKSMSSAVDCRRALLGYNDSSLIHYLIDTFDQPELEQGSQSLQALSILVDIDVVKRLISYEDIFSKLASIARGKQNCLATKAVQILKKTAYYISVRDESHQELLDALVSCTDSPRRHIRRWATKGLQVQSESSVNSFFLARNDSILRSIINLSHDVDRDVRDTALETLFNVANEASNTRRAASSTKYLEAFVSNSLTYLANSGEEERSTTRLSIRGILKLSEHPKSQVRVAKQKGVVESLAWYGISADSDVELKSAALHGVLLLAKFL